jgi:hypothetical protein
MTQRLQGKCFHRPRGRGLQVEQLEDRRLLSGVAPLLPTAPQVSGQTRAAGQGVLEAAVGNLGPSGYFGALVILARSAGPDGPGVRGLGDPSGLLTEGVRGGNLSDDGSEFLAFAEGTLDKGGSQEQLLPGPSVAPGLLGTSSQHSGSPVTPEPSPARDASDVTGLVVPSRALPVTQNPTQGATGNLPVATPTAAALAPADETLTPGRTTVTPPSPQETASATGPAAPAGQPAASPRQTHSLSLPATINDVAAAVAAELVAYVAQAGGGRDGSSQAEHVSRLLASNATGHEARGTGDTLNGGSAQAEVALALPPQTPTGAPREVAVPAPTEGSERREATPVTDRRQDAPVKARPAEPGGTAERTRDDAAPQDAGLLTDISGSSEPGSGTLSDRLPTLLTGLADSGVAWRLAPVLAAALAGGTAFGIVRRRRKKRQRPALAPVAPAKDTDTWLPPPSEPPVAGEP